MGGGSSRSASCWAEETETGVDNEQDVAAKRKSCRDLHPCRHWTEWLPVRTQVRLCLLLFLQVWAYATASEGLNSQENKKNSVQRLRSQKKKTQTSGPFFPTPKKGQEKVHKEATFVLLNRKTDSLLATRCTRKDTGLARRALLAHAHGTSYPTLWVSHRHQAPTHHTQQQAPGSLSPHRNEILRVLNTLHLNRLA